MGPMSDQDACPECGELQCDPCGPDCPGRGDAFGYRLALCCKCFNKDARKTAMSTLAQRNQAELNRVKEGSDPTPLTEDAEPTAGQLWRMLLAYPVEIRMARLAFIIDLVRRRHQCVASGHENGLDPVKIRKALKAVLDNYGADASGNPPREHDYPELVEIFIRNLQ
jgi:hypothetical protein